MNNKGFAATGMLYIVLLLFIAMYSSLLIMFANRRKIYDNIKDEIVNGVSNVDEPIYNLIDVVNVGDYVAYDAGVWTETVEKPTSHGEFGGYTAGENKSNSVDWCYDSSYTSVLKGWRVLKIENNKVYLVHAGISECYYHGTDPASSITNLNNRAASEYLNATYAESAHMLNYDEAVAITGNGDVTTNGLRYIGPTGTTNNSAFYWSASQYSTIDLWDVGNDGNIKYGHYDNSFGVRPIVILNSTIKTTGKTIDAVGQVAWNLIAP